MKKLIAIYLVVSVLCGLLFVYGVANIVVKVQEVGLKNIVENVWKGDK